MVGWWVVFGAVGGLFGGPLVGCCFFVCLGGGEGILDPNRDNRGDIFWAPVTRARVTWAHDARARRTGTGY